MSGHESEAAASDSKAAPKKRPFYKRPVLMAFLGLLLVVGIVAAVVWWMHARKYVSTDDASIDGHIIQISPDVSADVAAVYINDNWHVKKGQLLVTLDPRSFQAVVDQAMAGLAAARAKADQAQVQLSAARAEIVETQAAVVIAKTNAENATLNYQRFAALSPRARSQQQLDNALATHKSADAQIQQAEAKVLAARADADGAEAAVTTARAQIKVAQADLDQAKIDLGYCRIVAPEPGMITRKAVEPGSYVEKGQPLFAIVPTNVWVVANFKETKLGRIRIDQPVTIKIDAYSGHVFHGRVDSIQNGTGSRFSLLPPENATGNWVKVVQRVPVKITFDDNQAQETKYLLAPGLSVEAKVKVK
jgi:membrane fusion protein (multidrug efflux system)